MAQREFRHAIDDMLSAIEGIQRATADRSLQDYANDWLLKHAVEIISEASRALPPTIQDVRPEIPWARVRDIGNVLRHEYHGLSDRIIWGVVVDELPPLKEALLAIQAATDP